MSAWARLQKQGYRIVTTAPNKDGLMRSVIFLGKKPIAVMNKYKTIEEILIAAREFAEKKEAQNV